MIDRLPSIEKKLKEKNCVMSNNTILPIKNKDYVYYYCKEHMEIGEQKTREDSFNSKKFLCKECRKKYFSETRSGENSPTWKGGNTKLLSKLRYSLNDWISFTLKKFGYTCFLAGKKDNLEVHHIISFNTIVEIIANEMNIDIYKNISNYPKEILNELEKRVLDYHFNNDIGVVLNYEVHKDFHRIYGKGNNTKEQFDEFCKNFGEIKNTSFYDVALPKSKISNSNYVGVYKKENGWQVLISYHGKLLNVGLYQNLYRAVTAYNKKAEELFGDFARLNDTTGLRDHWVYEDSYFRFKKNTSSIYTGVQLNGGLWQYSVTDKNGKKIRGFVDSELECAYLYNKKKIELYGEDTVVNFLSFEEEEQARKQVERKSNFYEHKTNGDTIYTNVRKNKSGWKVIFSDGRKTVTLPNTYQTDKDSAIAYNNHVIENSLDKKLNRIVD